MLEQLTRELAEIPSHEDETEAGDYIESWLRRETDAGVERDDAGNVIAQKNAEDDGDSLAFVGHHDVVPPAEGQVEDGEYVVEKSDRRLYGRGTADMKGALAAAMLAFRDASPSPSVELIFASFVGEEVGGMGARHAINEGFAPDYAVVTEGSTGYSADNVTDVAVAHKGRRETVVTARGKSTHASEVEKGENAIYRAADALDKVRNVEFPETEVYGETMKGSTAVTKIHGGETRNVIPDRCEFTVDERTVPGDSVEFSFGENIDMEVTQNLPPMVCEDDEFAEKVLEAAKANQNEGASPELVTKPHATDAGWLSEAGTECVVCGPAEPGEAHTANESVNIDVLE
ncbi:MAG: M20/M25/M40 family metallo-hydrolase, partial [Halobacteria archaeon]|nr:M20/M25/M40 family metallo-hydrolase [Halobacteria archaeon]